MPVATGAAPRRSPRAGCSPATGAAFPPAQPGRATGASGRSPRVRPRSRPRSRRASASTARTGRSTSPCARTPRPRTAGRSALRDPERRSRPTWVGSSCCSARSRRGRPPLACAIHSERSTRASRGTSAVPGAGRCRRQLARASSASTSIRLRVICWRSRGACRAGRGSNAIRLGRDMAGTARRRCRGCDTCACRKKGGEETPCGGLGVLGSRSRGVPKGGYPNPAACAGPRRLARRPVARTGRRGLSQRTVLRTATSPKLASSRPRASSIHCDSVGIGLSLVGGCVIVTDSLAPLQAPGIATLLASPL